MKDKPYVDIPIPQYLKYVRGSHVFKDTLWTGIDLEPYLQKLFPTDAEVNKRLKDLKANPDKLKSMDKYQREKLLKDMTPPDMTFMEKLSDKVLESNDCPVDIMADMLNIPRNHFFVSSAIQSETGLLSQEVSQLMTWGIVCDDRSILKQSILELAKERLPKPVEKK